jgi:hypothetical protein
MVCDVRCFIILLRKGARFHIIGHYHHIACRVLGLVFSSSLINSQEVLERLCNWTFAKIVSEYLLHIVVKYGFWKYKFTNHSFPYNTL